MESRRLRTMRRWGALMAVLLLAALTRPVAAENPTDHMFPVALHTPGEFEMLLFESGGNSLGVLDIPSYRKSTEQAMYPWYHESGIPASEGGYYWVLSRFDRFHGFDADGDGTEEVLVTNGDTEIAVIDGSPTSLQLQEIWTSGGVLSGPAGSWSLGWQDSSDRFTRADLDGNGDDEMLIFGNYEPQNLTWFGVLDYRPSGMRLMYRADVMNNRATVDGVPINLGTTFQAMDLRGNGRDEIVARIPLDQPSGAFELAVFRATRRELLTEAYSDGPNITTLGGGEAWYFDQSDSLLPMDVDGDGRDEILAVGRGSQRMGFIRLRESDSQLVVFAEAETQGNSLFVRGARGEDDLVAPFSSDIRFYPVDVDGNGIDEIAYFWPSSSSQTLGVFAFIQGELRHVWSTPRTLAGPNGDIFLAPDASVYAWNVDSSAREEILFYTHEDHDPAVHVLRAGADGMVVSLSEDLGPVGYWSMSEVYDAPAFDFPEWTTPGQIQAYGWISLRLVGHGDVRSEYVLDAAIPETWLAILVGLNKPANISQGDWNKVRAQLADELQALAKVMAIFDRMQELNTYTETALRADANHVDQMMRSAIAVPPGGTGIEMSPLSWVSQFVGVVGGGLGSPATSSIQFMLLIIDGLTTPPATVPLTPGDILADYKIMLTSDLVDVRQETESRERVVRGDWGKLATIGTRYRGMEIGNLPGRSDPHTQQLYRMIMLELYTINFNPGFLKGSSWDPTRHTPSYFTYDFDRTDPYAIRVGMVRKPSYNELIGFPSQAVADELDYDLVPFLLGRRPVVLGRGSVPQHKALEGFSPDGRATFSAA